MTRVIKISDIKYADLLACDVCKEATVIKAGSRMAELPAKEQEIEYTKEWCKGYQAIGLYYIHINGKVCDKPLYKLVRI